MLSGVASTPNPVSTLVNTTAELDRCQPQLRAGLRSRPIRWRRTTAPAAAISAAQLADANFGKAVPAPTFDPATLRGWGKRHYNWEFSAGVQHELLPRVVVDVGYFRRWYGNFTVTDNLAIAPADYDPFSITAPLDPRLPGGGGYIDRRPLRPQPEQGSASRRTTTSPWRTTTATQIEHWNGVDVSAERAAAAAACCCRAASAPAGRRPTTATSSPKLDNPSPLYCHVDTAFLTQVKFLGTYTVPRVDVQVAATFQSIPGPDDCRPTTWPPTPSSQPSLGRTLAGNARQRHGEPRRSRARCTASG